MFFLFSFIYLFIYLLDVSVKEKAANHHFAGKGFGSAYQLDGKDVADLVLEVGQQVSLFLVVFSRRTYCFNPTHISFLPPQCQ